MSREGEMLWCNLCWKEMQAPFIVTTCGHTFCMEHKDDPKIKESTCPGCNKHVSTKNGMKIGHYEVSGFGDPKILNGLRPEQALQLYVSCRKFWSEQEENKLQYTRAQAKRAKPPISDMLSTTPC